MSVKGKQHKGSVAKRKVQQNGGAREGAGRKPLYGSKLDKKVPVRFDEPGQRKAILAFCREKHVDMAMFAREAALKRAGLERLGLELEKVYGTADPKDIILQDDTLPIIKLTMGQHTALTKYVESKGLKLSPFIREAMFAEMGKPELGVAGQAAAAVRKVEQALK